MTLPQRVQDELQAAEALENADKAARANAAQVLTSAADLIVPPTTPQASANPQVPPPPAQPAQPDEDFRQKYKSLQGVYNADVVQLRNQLKEMASVVQSLTAQKTAPQSSAPTVDPKDIETFGEEMMGMVQRYVTGAVTALESRIVQLETTVNGVAQKTAETAEQQFYKLLTDLVPDWRKINTQNEWLQWLGEVDDIYGVPRQQALDHAFGNSDAHRVAKVFKAFKDAQPPVSTSTLDSLITPDGAASVAPTAVGTNKPILSQKAITDFYNDLARGTYAGRQEEADAIEARINEAVAENRVR